MKKTIIFILLVLFIYPSALKAQDQKKMLYQNKVISFTKMKRSGIGLTIGGVLLTIGGAAMMVDGARQLEENDRNETYDTYDSTSGDMPAEFIAGYVTACLGVGATSGGIVLWSIGASKAKKYQQKINSFSLNLNPGQRQVFSLAYRF